jgi:hypothetical protein
VLFVSILYIKSLESGVHTLLGLTIAMASWRSITLYPVRFDLETELLLYASTCSPSCSGEPVLESAIVTGTTSFLWTYTTFQVTFKFGRVIILKLLNANWVRIWVSVFL